MIEVWDYFMRRKGVLLAFFTVFLMSSILSYNVFRSSAADHPTEYISIHNWGDDKIEVPHTGGEIQPVVLAVLRPEEVTNLAPRLDTEEAPNLAPPLDAEVVAEHEPGATPDLADTQQGNESLATTENPGVTPDPLAEQPADSPSEESPENDSEVSDNGTEPSSDDPESPAESPEESPAEPSADATDQNLANQDSGYLIFLVIMGLIVAGFGTYFLEQHFWR